MIYTKAMMFSNVGKSHLMDSKYFNEHCVVTNCVIFSFCNLIILSAFFTKLHWLWLQTTEVPLSNPSKFQLGSLFQGWNTHNTGRYAHYIK